MTFPAKMIAAMVVIGAVMLEVPQVQHLISFRSLTKTAQVKKTEKELENEIGFGEVHLKSSGSSRRLKENIYKTDA